MYTANPELAAPTAVSLTEIESKIHSSINNLSGLLAEKSSLLTELDGGKEGRARRYTVFPPHDEESFEFLVKQQNLTWVSDELDFTVDANDYLIASPEIKRIMDGILSFFLVADGVITENIVFRFILESSSYEEKAMFIQQLQVELVHSQTYGLAAITFHKSEEKLAEEIEKMEKTEAFMAKIKFMEKWMTSDRPRWQRLAAFAVSEGVFFPGPFAFIFWLRTLGLFQNFAAANELIACDEFLHRDFGSFLSFKEIRRLISTGELTMPEVIAAIKEIVLDGYNCASLYIGYLLPAPVKDLSREGVKSFVKCICDKLSFYLCGEKFFNCKNQLHFMDMLITEGKANFYETRVSNYSGVPVKEVLDWKKRAGITKRAEDHYNNPEDADI